MMMKRIDNVINTIKYFSEKVIPIPSDKTLEFVYNQETLENFYTSAILSFAELEEYFESRALHILEVAEELYKNNDKCVTVPIISLIIKKSFDVTGKYISYKTESKTIIFEVIKHYRNAINGNYGINKDKLNDLFNPIGFIESISNDLWLTTFLNKLEQLSKWRHEGAHKSFADFNTLKHTPNELKQLLLDISEEIEVFEGYINNFLIDIKSHIKEIS